MTAPLPANLHYRRMLFDVSRVEPKAVEALGGDPFRPLEAECGVVQFVRRMSEAEYRKAAELMRHRPDVQLYVYGTENKDLEFLKFFENLRRLHVALYDIEDIAGFAHLNGSLEELTLGASRRHFSLRFLESLPRLSRLFLVGHKKDLATLAQLRHLRNLGLSGITLQDLSVILPLTGLRHLFIALGGTRDLRLLPAFRELEDLRLMRIGKFSDLAMLAEMPALKSLDLDWMRNVTSLPSFAPLIRLEKVRLELMKGLTDLSTVAAAPALRSLSVTQMPQLTAESFRCFVGHPALQELWAYVGKSRTNEEVKRMLPGIAR